MLKSRVTAHSPLPHSAFFFPPSKFPLDSFVNYAYAGSRGDLMAKHRLPSARFRKFDLASWNFIIFLTLAFVLLVVVLSAMNKVSLDLRSRAGLACPQLSLPRAEDCAGGWTFKRDVNGCLAFFCEPKAGSTKSK